MRKQTKIAAVVSAAALLALGASMTSFAASKGTWMMVDGEWYCYDKNGDAYTNVFCSSNGKEYFVGDDGDVYCCGDEDDGHAKKNKWIKTWLPNDTNEEEDDKEWFWFDKEGKVFRANISTAAETAANAYKYKLDEGALVPDNDKRYDVIGKKKVNSKDYWFREDGVMLSKFYQVGDNMFYFYTKAQYGHAKGAGVIGNQSNKLYYYGMLIQADDYKYQLATIAKDGVDYSFIVNSNGTIQHSKSTEYKEDGDVLIATGIKDASGKATETKFVENGQFKYAISNAANNWDTVSKNVADIDMSGFVQGK